MRAVFPSFAQHPTLRTIRAICRKILGTCRFSTVLGLAMANDIWRPIWHLTLRAAGSRCTLLDRRQIERGSRFDSLSFPGRFGDVPLTSFSYFEVCKSLIPRDLFPDAERLLGTL